MTYCESIRILRIWRALPDATISNKMCGIIGVTRSPGAPQDSLLTRMTAAIRHRAGFQAPCSSAVREPLKTLASVVMSSTEIAAPA